MNCLHEPHTELDLKGQRYQLSNQQVLRPCTCGQQWAFDAFLFLSLRGGCPVMLTAVPQGLVCGRCCAEFCMFQFVSLAKALGPWNWDKVSTAKL